MNTEQINELRQLAQAATPGPWYDRAGVLRGTGGGIKPIATIYNGLNSPYIAAANPAAILALIAEIDSLRDEVNGLTGELGRERKRLDFSLNREGFYDHTTRVFFCDRAFKIPNPQVRIETDNFRATIDELMVQS
ncbi:MAG: ead/Ea22-like family protein [Pseudomonadota bacterium]|nr:ead/Ea22-like family protein [Pseudomonadota bacterium]